MNEEVDGILLLNLKQLGLGIDKDKVDDIQEADLIRAMSRGLSLVSDEFKFSEVLPRGFGAQYKLRRDLEAACKKLGYLIDAEKFHYPEPNETRKLLSWLIQKVPKTEEGVGDATGATVQTESDRIEQLALTEFGSWTQQPWAPPAAAATRLKNARIVQVPFHSIPISIPDSASADAPRVKYQRRLMPLITSQASNQHVTSSVLENHAIELALAKQNEARKAKMSLDDQLNEAEYLRRMRADLLRKIGTSLKSANGQSISGLFGGSGDLDEYGRTKRGRFQNLVAFQDDAETSQGQFAGMTLEERRAAEEEARRDAAAALKNKRQAEIQSLNDAIQAILERIEELEGRQATNKEKLSTIAERWQVETDKTPALESEYKMKKSVFDLLPDADKNIADLQALAEGVRGRIRDLEAEWEKHRKPLVAAHDAIRAEKEAQMKQWTVRLDEIKEMRKRMKDMLQEVREKEARHAQLVELYDKLPHDVDRLTYTYKITKLTDSMKKQYIDIAKILMDTRSVQKEINHINDVLGRSFAVTDEMVFSEAKKDPTFKPVYRYLAALHENFQSIIESVEDTGQSLNAIRDLETQTESLISRISTMNMERVANDLKQVRDENAKLEQQLE